MCMSYVMLQTFGLLVWGHLGFVHLYIGDRSHPLIKNWVPSCNYEKCVMTPTLLVQLPYLKKLKTMFSFPISLNNFKIKLYKLLTPTYLLD